MTRRLPKQLGSYEIVRRLGVSGSSEVFLAQARGPFGFERTVVLKRPLPGDDGDDATYHALAREAVAYARLNHPAIVRLYDFVALEGEPVLVLEHVAGVSLLTLTEHLRATGAHLEDAAVGYIGHRIFSALAAAHGARHPTTGEFSPVIHRDVSPGNVLVSIQGEVKLGDFGLARIGGVPSRTPCGLLRGTFGYMAPEQVLGDPTTVRTDIYGACLLLWELYARRRAFAIDAPELVLLQSMAAPALVPVHTLRYGIPVKISEALAVGLAADPDVRSLGASEMEELFAREVDINAGRASLMRLLDGARDALLAAAAEQGPRPSVPSTYEAYEEVREIHQDGPASLSDSERPTCTSLPNSAAAAAADADRGAREGSDAPSFTPGGLARTSLDAATKRVLAPPAPKRWPFVAAACGVALFVTAAAFVRVDRRSPSHAAAGPNAEGAEPAPHRPSSTPPEAHATSAQAHPEQLVDDDLPAASVAGLSPDEGLVVPPPHAAGHRVFVDGRMASEGAHPIRVACGRRVVRIGSSGPRREVDVPCGGEAKMTR